MDNTVSMVALVSVAVISHSGGILRCAHVQHVGNLVNWFLYGVLTVQLCPSPNPLISCLDVLIGSFRRSVLRRLLP